MKFQVGYKYKENYKPPRCRKLRVRELKDSVEVEIPDVHPEDAPIAFAHQNCGFPGRVVYRWYNGALYTHARDNRVGVKGWETITGLRRRLASPFLYGCMHDSREEAIAYARSRAEEYIIISGRGVWHKTGEPRYEIVTFGLGGNHAETALMISNEYNSNIPASRYFSALQRKEAVEEAIRVAMNRGDTYSVSAIRRAWKINVHIPEAVRCDPKAEAGPGDPFLNQLDAITTVKDPVAAGLLAIGMIGKES